MRNYTPMQAHFLVFFAILYCLAVPLEAQTYYYYSRQSGNWNDTNTWSTVSHTGPPATTTPVALANVIIGNNHTVTSTSNLDLLLNQNIIVNANSKLILQAGNTNLISSFTINGTLQLEGGSLNGNSITFNNGSTYIHARDGGDIPTITWHPGSECRITGITNMPISSGLNQTFGNFTWQCPNQNVTQNFFGNMTIQGKFNLLAGTVNLNSVNLIVQDSTTINGFLLDNNLNGSNTFNNDVIISSNGTWNTTTASNNNLVTLNGNITHNNPTLNSFQADVLSFNTANKSLLGATSAAPFVVKTLTVNDVSNITNYHKIELDNLNLIGTNASFVQGVSSILRFRNAATITRASPLNTDFHTYDNIVEYVGLSGDVFEDHYSDLVINATGVKTITGNISVNDLVIQNGTLNGSNSIITITGNFDIFFGNFNAGSSTVVFNGNTFPQNIPNGITFYNLTINSLVGVLIANGTGDVNVSNALALNNGHLSLGNNSLVYNGTEANLTRINGWIVTNGTGSFVRGIAGNNFTFPVGDNTYYQPVRLAFSMSNASVRVGTPSITIPSVGGVGSWYINNGNIITDVTFINPQGATLSSSSKVHVNSSGNWVLIPTTHSFFNNNYTANVYFSGSTIELAIINTLPDFYTLGDGATWNVDSNLWSNDGINPCYCSPNSVAEANVRIRHNTNIPVGSNVTSSTIIDIQNPVTLVSNITFTAQQLNGVAGAKLSIIGNSLPSFNVNNFAATNGTIVEFSGGGGGIPANFGGNPYKNLEISGNYSLSAATLVQENLTIHMYSSLDVSSFNLSVNGSTTVSGTLKDGNDLGTNQFTGTVVINPTGQFIATNGLNNNSNFIFGNNITNQGVFNLDCNCQIDFNISSSIEINSNSSSGMIFGATNSSASVNFKRSVRFAGNNPITFNTLGNLVVDSNVTVSNHITSGGVRIYGNLVATNSTSTWQQSDNALLYYYANTKPMAAGNLLANAFNNTVRYDNSSINASFIKETTYQNLELWGSSTKLFFPSTIVEKLLDGSNTALIDLQGNTLQVKGDWVGRTVGGVLSAINGKVLFNGNTPQTIINTTNFDVIEIDNPAHVTLSNADNFTNRVILTQGRLRLGNNNFILQDSPATNQITQTFSNSSTSYIETNGSGTLSRLNLQANIPYVFPIGNASSIRHLTVTLSVPAASGDLRARFETPINPNPPAISTDLAAGQWFLRGADGVSIIFENSGATGFASKVHRLNNSSWDDTGITTTFNAGKYTASPLNFLDGETYTIFGQSPNHVVLLSSFTQTPQPDGSILLSAVTNYNLSAKFISTNTNVAQIFNNNTLVVTYNNTNEYADILAFNEGQPPIPPSDTVRVLRIYNYSYINALNNDIQHKVLIYPNPTRNKVHLQILDNKLEIFKIDIINQFGQKVVDLSNLAESKIYFNSLPAGVYIIEIHTQQGVVRKKIIKQ